MTKEATARAKYCQINICIDQLNNLRICSGDSFQKSFYFRFFIPAVPAESSNACELSCLCPPLPYDPQKDFEAVTLINTTPLVVVIHPGVPAKNTEQFIALAKSHPGALNFGSSGSGGSNHLAGELFNSMAGVKMVHIPYKGNAPALTDLVGGHLDVVFNGLTSAIPLIRGSKLRAIGVTSLERASAMPDVATLNEQGLKGFLAVAWNGIMAPAHTPKDIVNKINDDVRKVVRVPEMLERLKADGSDASTLGVEAYQKFLKDETIKWRKVIQQAGLKTLQ
jgi:tripartite-type tricarboxylate transporter receptor subunit TctC